MTGQNKTAQERHAGDEPLILVGECQFVRDAVEFINAKVQHDGWHLLAQPFPMEIRAVTVIDPTKPKVDGRSQTKVEHFPASWGFVLHKFY